jgi:hypothetical protein
MDYERFYTALFAPLRESIGPIDKNTIFAIIGFDVGGPLNFCTIGADRSSGPISYISCELAVRDEQVPTKDGGYRYELLTSCDDEQWVRKVLTKLGRMSLEVAFDHGHTVDIGSLVNQQGAEGAHGSAPPIQGVLFQRECITEHQGKRFGVLRCVGITRAEMEFAMTEGSSALVSRLIVAGVWPHTLVHRRSIL